MPSVSAKPTVLVVDDRPNMRRLLAKVLGAEANVLSAGGGREALEVLAREPVDVVLSDLRMPDLDGVAVLREGKKLRPRAEFVLMTAYASVDSAVEAMRLGAYDYLTKPFEPSEVRAIVARALARAGVQRVEEAEDGVEVLPGLVARSVVMRELAELVRRVAASAATALLLGETGTGKERVARAVHQLSPRAGGRFVAVNCAAIPAELLESELFGYRRGAFSGAVTDRAGLFEEAAGGTLFLDEIGDMRLSLQAKLTRALEEKAIRRVGEAEERRVDVRVVAATHRDLARMAATGAFREDLWYRLNVAAIAIPPLRERGEDVALLARHFLATFAAQGGEARELSDGALDALRAYAWPGNVRQLRAAIERAAIVARGPRVELGDLPPEIAGHAGAADPDEDLAHLDWASAQEAAKQRFARRYLRALLRAHDGRVADAASAAGVERESFYRLLRKHGVSADDYREG
ncbi:MAG: sigma-54-dependent Fis family transcriptional regulator [Sandaracinaceae bacterium]|nr:sigma-54-dependent Fis family transcriptional regulator [Sandaracinaceae bacterium]